MENEERNKVYRIRGFGRNVIKLRKKVPRNQSPGGLEALAGGCRTDIEITVPPTG